MKGASYDQPQVLRRDQQEDRCSAARKSADQRVRPGALHLRQGREAEAGDRRHVGVRGHSHPAPRAAHALRNLARPARTPRDDRSAGVHAGALRAHSGSAPREDHRDARRFARWQRHGAEEQGSPAGISAARTGPSAQADQEDRRQVGEESRHEVGQGPGQGWSQGRLVGHSEAGVSIPTEIVGGEASAFNML